MTAPPCAQDVARIVAWVMFAGPDTPYCTTAQTFQPDDAEQELADLFLRTLADQGYSVTPGRVWADVAAERARADAKHGATSMERLPPTDMTWLSVLVEEVGEVAREFCDARHRAHPGLLPQAEREQSIDRQALRTELVQVAAMAGAWADRLSAEANQ